MMGKFYKKILSITTAAATLCLTSLEAEAFMWVASVANNGIVNFTPDPTNPAGGTFEDVFTPGLSSIKLYDENTGEFIKDFVPPGTGTENVTVASGITIGPDGNLYANDQAENSVKIFDSITGEFLGYAVEPNGTPNRPEGIVFDPQGESFYVSGLTASGVKRYSWNPSGPSELIDFIDFNPFADVLLAAAIMNFDEEGKLYLGSVFNDNSILRYDPETKELDQFVPPEEAQPIPSGIVFDEEGRLYNGSFSGPFFGFPETTIKRYDSEGEFLEEFVTAEGNGGLDVASRLRFGPDDNLYVSNFGGSSIMRYDGDSGEFIDAFVPVNGGGLENPGGLVFFTPDAASVPESSSLLAILGFGVCLGASSLVKKK